MPDELELADKKLLVVGAGHEQVPAIVRAKQFGIKVYATDWDSEAPGAKLANKFEKISTADKDKNLEFAQASKVDGVMTLSSELAVPVVAYVAEKMALNTGLDQDIALRATNKNVMHRAFVANGTPCATSKKVNGSTELQALIKEHAFPVVIKPSDSSGQKGVCICYSKEELQVAIEDAAALSSDGYAIAEQYIEGPEINVTAMVCNGVIEFLSFSHRVTAPLPHFGIAVEHVVPPSISQESLQDVKEAAEKAIQAIGLSNGIAYPQIIASATHGARVIEIAARIPGGYMRDVALLSGGVDLIDVAICQSLGIHLPRPYFENYPKYRAVRVNFLTKLDYPETQKVSKISGFTNSYDYPKASDASGVLLSECRLQVGMNLPALTSSSARFAAIIGYGSSLVEVNKEITQVQKRVVIE